MAWEFGEKWMQIKLPIHTVSEGNGGFKKRITRANMKPKYTSEHWTSKQHRHKRQKGAVHLFLRPMREELKLPMRIVLTRFAPKKLGKYDNLPMAFKWILDAICEVITGDYLTTDFRPGRADDQIEDQIEVVYKQVQSKDYAVIMRFELLDKINSIDQKESFD